MLRYVNFQCRVSLLFLVCIAIRLCYAGRYLDCCDSVDFALGLREYDINLLQPHFPGYPVYLFTAWLFSWTPLHTVWSLEMPGVLFGSLSVYPLAFLTRKLFSERVALLAVILFIINPLCWLQAERPTSDAMGLFFILSSANMLCGVLTSKSSLNQDSRRFGKGAHPLFWGSFVFGIGLGVRLSYFPFIALIVYAVYEQVIQGRQSMVRAVFWGLAGFLFGVCLWLFPQISLTGWQPLLHNGLSFSHGHFTDWGGSAFTFWGWKRIVCLARSLWLYGLGGWWPGTSPLSVFPSVAMLFCIFYAVKQHSTGRRYPWSFLAMYAVPYLFWLLIGQNVSNTRHVLPIIPVILILISYGLCKLYEAGRGGISPALLLIFALVINISITSYTVVARYHNTVPAPVQLIRFIEEHFDYTSTRIYCGEERRFFDYYAPLWDAREVRDVAGLRSDMQSSLFNPETTLFITTPENREKSLSMCLPLTSFDVNPYLDGTKKVLTLCMMSEL